MLIPVSQRQSMGDLLEAVDLSRGDGAAKRSGFFIMLVLSGVIAVAGVLADSTATVIGAMIIAPLGTPILGIAAGIVTGHRTGRQTIGRLARRQLPDQSTVLFL